jgi:hypothetical protein
MCKINRIALEFIRNVARNCHFFNFILTLYFLACLILCRVNMYCLGVEVSAISVCVTIDSVSVSVSIISARLITRVNVRVSV